MSRGHGKVQRQVLAYLDEDGGWCWLHDLAGDAFDTDTPSRSQIESARRAIRSLERERLVKTGHKADGNEAIRLVARSVPVVPPDLPPPDPARVAAVERHVREQKRQHEENLGGIRALQMYADMLRLAEGSADDELKGLTDG